MYCWICEQTVDAFLPYGIPPKQGRCPHCGAKPRYRAIAWYLAHVVAPRLGRSGRVLEVGPSRMSVRSYLPRLAGARYTAIDLRELPYHAEIPAPHEFLAMDVTAMRFDDACFDLILCNNTLPYIRDDRRALAEIRRCLRDDGMAMLNTHIEPGGTRDVETYRLAHPELTEAYFAENGDQWVYGTDLYDRIARAGLVCHIEPLFVDAGPDYLRTNGLKHNSELLLAFRTPAGRERFLDGAGDGSR